jgi:peptidyl-dipeptidase Dcp
MNILLKQPFDTPYQTPPFHQIKEDDYLPAIREAIAEAKKEVDAIVENPAKPDFKNTIEALEKTGKQLNVISNIFFNLNHADTNEKIQSIAREVSPLLTEFSNDIRLNEKLFERIRQVHETSDRSGMREDQIKLLEDTYKDFVLNGALLTGKDKEHYREITKELAQLSLKFGENVLAETNGFKLHITDEKDLSGIPEGAIEAAAALAQSEDKEGWMFSLHFPSYMAFMKYADNRELREKLYR